MQKSNLEKINILFWKFRNGCRIEKNKKLEIKN